MSVTAISIIAAIIASGALDVYLRRRQMNSVRASRDSIPVDFRSVVTLEEHRRAADYTLANARLGALHTIFDTGLSVLWLTVLLAPLYALVAALFEPGLMRSVAFVMAIGAVSYGLALPFALVKTFKIEAAFGFNRTTPRIFALDQIKGLVLQFVIAAPLLFGLFWLIEALPRLWWVIGWAATVLLTIGASVIYPMWIAPLFNAFRPLPDGPMKSRIEALLARCGFKSNGLYVMDASKRSSHGNAYFTGFGKVKRIVFFDTLLEKHTEDEIISVLAHELGHFKLGHIGQRLAQSAILLFVIFAVLHWAFSAGGLASQFGLPDDPGIVLMIVSAALGPLLRLSAPLLNFLSRRAEFQADAFAKAIVGEEDMINALTRLSRDNLATLTPDRIYAMFYYSHPPIPIRVAQLKAA
ncbi:Ste24 endopeptidase [Methylocella silvestris BL2]|uniref:Ste24 endopeptidase n=1 Tax=Methylocella silvestris (strain DSM 15510 / CIP 108128 / LMG 27833 / NCIMB 13906 / BL2) TaxID=395965 RepID=B8EIF8_METSB|nr:M48 family metallopeptidase [Methylocella silvestris]ACK51277.1 Ste24 endopeptidase [Methylocella silvestris BL2]